MASADFSAPPQFRTAAPKPKMTVYFALNIISFMAMLLACLFLYLEIRRFGGFGVVSGQVAAVELVPAKQGKSGALAYFGEEARVGEETGVA